MRPVLIIHFSKRRSILSHGQKVCAHVSKRCISVCVCVVAEGVLLVMGGVDSCTQLNGEFVLFYLLNLCESEVGQMIFC